MDPELPAGSGLVIGVLMLKELESMVAKVGMILTEMMLNRSFLSLYLYFYCLWLWNDNVNVHELGTATTFIKKKKKSGMWEFYLGCVMCLWLNLVVWEFLDFFCPNYRV